MTKNRILSELTIELVECKRSLEAEKPPRGTKSRIKKLENAIEVIKALPPQCKACYDKLYAKNWEGKVIPCPECNPYGEEY